MTRTGEFSYRLAGNGPVLFEMEEGLIHQLGSHRPLREQIRDLRLKENDSEVQVANEVATIAIAVSENCGHPSQSHSRNRLSGFEIEIEPIGNFWQRRVERASIIPTRHHAYSS
jgi:hypothetical protein